MDSLNLINYLDNLRTPQEIMTTYKIVLVRHGESEWNQSNRFCGWHDADLTDKGVEEAKFAGKVKYCFESLISGLFQNIL